MPSKKVQSITDRLIKRVELALDDRSWPITITHNVLIEVEDLTGLNVLAGEVNLIKPSFKLVRAILYLALKRSGAKYSIEEVGDLIGPHNIVKIQEAILTAWAASMPEAEKDEADENPTEAAGK